MPLVGKVGRKRSRARFAMAFVYFCLTIGALTTVYPFLTMVTTGFKSNTDQNDNKLIPSFWSDDEELLTKYLDDKYSGNASMISSIQNTLDAHDEQLFGTYEDFLMQLPPDQWLAGFKTPSNNVTSRMNVKWQAFLKTKYKTVEEVNEVYNEINGAFQQVTPPPERLEDPTWNPKNDQKWDDWIEFKKTLPADFRIPITANRLYQEFVKSKYKNQFGDVPPDVIAASDGAKEFEQLTLSERGKQPADEKLFFESGVPKTFFAEGTIEAQWSQYMLDRGLDRYRFGPMVEPPILGYEEQFVTKNESSIRREFTWRNYIYVLDYILLNGRAVVNTILFCLLTILIQLTVNPMAAYALSRFPMKSTGRILLFLLATMAFPAEVAMIPSFLLLKDLNLLNTFAALVLPAAASGYMIFLLKGFFDSLPQEVFESGQIDGAPEWKMMLKIAFPLSKPVFGYMALLAFMGAYGAFIYAFLVAQNREMWTLMVFIYQLQLVAPKSVTMAAVTLAAIPTLAVFLLAQNVIMRGIVLPGER